MIFCTACGHPRTGPARFCTACGAPLPDAVSTEAPVAEPPPPPSSRHQPDTVGAYYPPGGGQAAPEQPGTPAGQQSAGHAAEDDPFGDIFAPRGGERGAPPSRPGPADAYQGYESAGPRDPRTPTPRGGRGKAVLAVLAAVAVLAAGGGAAFWLTHRHQAHGALAAPTAATSTVPATPTSSATPSGSATSSASPGTGSEQAEVTQITPEIQQSASARKTVVSATGAVGACTMVPATGIGLMDQAISQRKTVIGRLGPLSVNVIPHGRAMLADLRRVLQLSITADRGFVGWMHDIQAATCPVNTLTDASYQRAFRASARAVTAKKEFLALWNPIARKFGQPTFTPSQI